MTPIARACFVAAVGAALVFSTADIVHAAGLTNWDTDMASVADDTVGAGYYIGVVAVCLTGLVIALQMNNALMGMASVTLGAGLASRGDQVMATLSGGGGGGGILEHVTPWVQAVPF